MRYTVFLLVLLAASLMVGCAAPAAIPTGRSEPSVDRLLADAGLPTDFWHKDVTRYGDAPDGRKVWIVSGTETPTRAKDGECESRDYTWTVASDPENGRAALYTYPDDPTERNPEIGFIVNDDVSKRSSACDKIDFRDYFYVNDGVTPVQAILLLQDLNVAVDCVKQKNTQCERWKKFDVGDALRDDFLKLRQLRVFTVGWEDRDEHDWMEVRYMLYPPTKASPFFINLVCLVRTLPDGSLELHVTEGGPDP
jgi:hypothetical protein